MNENLWHEYQMPWWRWFGPLPKTIAGDPLTSLGGKIWRRRHNGAWEYQQASETLEDFLSRQY